MTYEYKGYIGVANYNEKRDDWTGEVTNTSDLVLFYSDSILELKYEFMRAVNRYLESFNFKQMKKVKMKFKDAPIGARFKFPNMKTIWVKINSYSNGNGLIVQWNGNVEGHQSFCSFVDENEGVDFDTVIELI